MRFNGDIFHAYARLHWDKLFSRGDRLRLPVERVLLINFIMDLAMLICALRPVRMLRPIRLCSGAALGAIAAAALEIAGAPLTIRCISAVFMAPVLVVVACRPFSLRDLAGATASFMAAGALTAAMTSLLPRNCPWALSAAAACLISGLVFGRRRRWLATWETRVDISFSGRHASFAALIDSGNRLREPISGLEVMIVSEKHVAKLMPQGFEAAAPWRTLPEGFRLVAYGGVGGGGELACFMPDSLVFTGGTGLSDKTGGIWVAVYPGELPGRTGALAPPTAME